MILLLGLATFIAILAVLILVHELGHFTLAKAFGVRVDEFGLGFPPRLKSVRRGGTLYSLNAVPLGGFVRMQGENGRGEGPNSFGSKSPWQRLLILVAGPCMNLLLAVAILFAALIIGSPRGLTVITKVDAGSPASAARLRPGDRIIAIDHHRVGYLDQLQALVARRAGSNLALQIRRGSHTFAVRLVPRISPPAGQGPIGVVLGRSTRVRYAPGQALGQSVHDVGSIVGGVPLLLQTVVQDGGNGVSGPIGIARATTDVVGNEPQQGIGSVFQFMSLLSATIGILNLLPIPALDGGRIVFVLLSWVRRRSLDPEVEGLVHMVGMAVLLMLILFISYHDLVQWVTGKPF